MDRGKCKRVLRLLPKQWRRQWCCLDDVDANPFIELHWQDDQFLGLAEKQVIEDHFAF